MPITSVLNREAIAACRLPGYGGLVAMSELGAIHYVDDELDDLLGLESGTLIGRSFLEFVHGDDVEQAVEAFTGIGRSPGRHRRLGIRLRGDDGLIDVDVVPDNRLEDPAVAAVLLHLAVTD